MKLSSLRVYLSSKINGYDSGITFRSEQQPLRYVRHGGTLPRKDDTIEIGFPSEQVVKSFTVWRVVHKMIQLPRFETKYYDGIPVQCKNDPPWRWETHLYGSLYDPKSEVPELTK